jgi:hypothetical protein
VSLSKAGDVNYLFIYDGKRDGLATDPIGSFLKVSDDRKTD